MIYLEEVQHRSTFGTEQMLNEVPATGLVSIFVQHRCTTFRMLNGLFQHLTRHDILFNIFSTKAVAFVYLQLLNCASTALERFQ